MVHTLSTHQAHILTHSSVAVSRTGLDLINGVVRNNLAAGVLEPAMSKIKSLKFATEAAITILRIDDMIKHQQADGEDPNSYQNALRSGQLSG